MVHEGRARVDVFRKAVLVSILVGSRRWVRLDGDENDGGHGI